MSTSWIDFDDSVEVFERDEDSMTDEIVASMGRVNRKVFDKHRHALRDAHAKSHGVLKGVLSVYEDLQEGLSQGIFQPGRSYGVVARLSSSPGDVHADKIRSLKGFALKVIGVQGAKVLPGKENELTQDFLMVNLPILPFGDVKAYLEFQLKSESESDRDEDPASVVPGLASTAASAMKAIGLQPSRLLEAIGASATHILGETFYTMAALRFGRYIAKLSLAPLSTEVRVLTGQEVDTGGNYSIDRDLVVDFFSKHGAEYEIRAQMCTDLSLMPVEDASVEWPPDVSPHLPLGKVIFPAQDAYSPARRVYADEMLSFNPWHCIEAHRPLGSIMRSRKKAYEASSAFRHAMNGQPRVEPREIDQIPD